MSHEFDNIADAIGVEDLNAEIVDGKFVITPAEAGVMLFSFLSIADEEAKQRHNDRVKLEQELELARDDNAVLRDILERVYTVLTEDGHIELADECIEAAYPITAIDHDGNIERF